MSKHESLHTRSVEAPTRKAALVEIKGVVKEFPGVRALNGVDLEIFPGEVHALCGENGAGKSTLMKALAGGVRPDAGEIRLAGQPYAPANPREARNSGIILVHQEMSLVPELSVAENIYLGALPRRLSGLVDRRKLNEQARAVIASCGYSLDPEAKVADLAIARQQMVEIARASAFPCSVVIFDEPTAALTEADAESLFNCIERLRRDNVAVIYISHKMNEVFRLSDRITVLRDGKTQATVETGSVTEDQILQLMIGRPLERKSRASSHRTGKELLSVSGFSSPGRFTDVTFSVAEGEILGFYGLVGAGRSDLAEALFGLRPAAGAIRWRGTVQQIRKPSDAVDLGVGFVPEDRKRQGLILGAGGRENVILASLRNLGQAGFLKRAKAAKLYTELAERLKLRGGSAEGAVVGLSGGNQQKIVLAKWLATKPRLLILDEPTRGIDVGAKVEVHKIIMDLAAHGTAVLLISSEMPEILALSDRIIVMHEGRVMGELDGSTAGEGDLIRAVMGRDAGAGETAGPTLAWGRDRHKRNHHREGEPQWRTANQG
jgi:ribose transport system ATP-binding protein